MVSVLFLYQSKQTFFLTNHGNKPITNLSSRLTHFPALGNGCMFSRPLYQFHGCMFYRAWLKLHAFHHSRHWSRSFLDFATVACLNLEFCSVHRIVCVCFDQSDLITLGLVKRQWSENRSVSFLGNHISLTWFKQLKVLLKISA